MPPTDQTALAPDTSFEVGIPARLRGLVQTMAMAGGLLYWAVFGLAFTVVGTVLHLLLPRRMGQQLGRWALHGAFRVFVRYLSTTGLVRADLRELDSLQSAASPMIIAPNHASLWDAVFIISRVPDSICIMKQSILQNLFLGGGARLAGFIPNAGPSRLVRQASAALAEGGNLLLFPEGTRTRRNARWVNPLKGGCALIASRARIPVQPVFIRSDSRYLEKGWPLFRRPQFPICMDISLGEPLYVEEGESLRRFNDRLQATYERELAKPHPLRRARPWRTNGANR